MMDEMKRILLLLAVAAAFAADLSQVHTVYILPMARGLDQYLANRLTKSHILQVVTDPEHADAVISDRLGPAFEQKMTDLYPPPPPPAPVKPEAPKSADSNAESKDQPSTPPPAPAAAAAMLGDTVNRLSKPMSSFGGGKGTIFLVSVKSREVLWSTFEQPKDARGSQMERVASKICDDLKKSISGK